MTNSTFEFIRHLTNLSIELEANGVSGAPLEEVRLRCHAPEGVLTPSLRQEIAARKTEIILFLQQAKQVKTSHQLPIQRVLQDGEAPLSFAQQRLWFLHHLSPDSRSYNLLDAQILHGSLNIVALEQSLSELIRRHEVLRTTFPTVDGKPVQVIAPPLRVRSRLRRETLPQRCLTTALILPIHNLQELSAQQQTEQIREMAKSLASQPFDLAVGPLVQFTLLQLSNQEYVLLLKMHHIIYDGWSLNIFKRELSQLYAAFAQRLPNPLPELSIQYADFAVWQRQWLTGEVLERQLNYWQQQLADASVVLELPTDKPRPPVQTFRGGVERFQLDRHLTQRLKQLSQESEATLFMTLLAAFLVLLSRYSGQLDIIVGSPIANRNNKSVEQLIGFFANTIALRGDLSGNPSFADFLAQVRQTTLSAYAHQDLPFEMLVEKLQPERDLSRNPLVQVLFSLQNDSQSFLDLPGLTTQRMSLPLDEMVRFDLEVNYWETSSGLEGVWSYNTDLFDAATITRIAQHFQTLLKAIVANPRAPIAELPLLSQAERHQLLVEWNDTQTNYPQDKCIHQLFEEQVKLTPDAVAVVFDNQQLTYQQLNYRANQLAHYLQTLGVKPDVLVGICVERSLEMIVGLLGILKAGGAYVPLDPEYPQDRLNFILEDTQVRVLLTQQQLVESLPKHQAYVVCLDTDWEKITQNSELNPKNTAKAENLAYVIYTSGSTGKPKGVLVNHSNVTRLFAATNSWYNFNSEDVWTLFHSYAFDFSVWEIWGALLYGGRLVVVPYLVTRSPESFYNLLSQEKVTILNQTPSAFRQLIQVERSIATVDDLKLRLVIFGGEALELKSLQPWFDRHGDQQPQLVNMYGITETTVHVTYRPLSKGDLSGTASVIGRPIPDLQVYVLDEHLQPVPIGVAGEMYVGGAGVTRGYLNRLELTQQRFISHPFSNYDKARLYKTGDLARYLPNGELEYLGRIDNQVKIRGFRIELGEIEALLTQHPAVWENVVIVREDEPGDKRLVAYVVPNMEQSSIVPELRQFLKTKLPEYMVPSAFVLLESLPLTSNGKVDHRALPKPELGSTLLEKYIAPRTPIEEMLALIWAQVLKVEQVGIHDNFFELGGHSLLATQLLSRIRNIFKIELPLRELFVAATVAELAKVIEQLQQQDLELSAPPILPRAENAELPLSYAQQRLWFLEQLEPNSAFYNVPIALRLAGSLNVAALEQSLQEIIHRHEALRTNFITIDGKPSQIIQTQTNWTVSVVDFKHLSTIEQEIAAQKLAQQQAIQPYDLARLALIRATLVVLSETENILLVCMHHVVSDGWSMGVFVQELSALYNAYSQGQPSPLTPLPIQYADFALWQRQWLQGDVLQRQLSYWQKQLASAPALLSLPTDRPRPAVQTFAGAYQQFALSQELTQKLTQLSQQQGVTLFMTLLAAYDTLLYRYTGVADILVGSPIANRDRSEIEGLIGFFVNTLVMRTNLAGNPSFLQLLTRVREMAMEAYSHQHLPFEMLVEALQPERNLSHTPLFQVMFALQDASIYRVELTGLTVSPLKVEGTTAKFDLTLLMQNTTAGLVGVWEYNTDLFDASTIERITGHFVTLLEGIIVNPQQQISQLPMLTQPEQQQLLVEWNNTQADYFQDKCIHELFEEQLGRTPDAVALVFGNQQLTYHQLNSQANQLAHYLRLLGVKPDVLVGICVERSLEMIVGLLGILKAGGAYLPLDPDYPTDRLAYMLNDSQVRVLLTQEKLLPSLPEHTTHVVCLDRDWEDISRASKDNPVAESTADNLAYVIYTSGSTGKPKGVLVNHSNVVRLFAATNSWYNFNSQDVWTLFHSYAFDFSVWEIWGALLYGGRLVVVPYLVTRSPESFYKLLCQEKITVLNQTPSAFRQLIQAEQSMATAGELNLRLVIFGGEALELSSLQPWFERHGDSLPQLVNMYGITETTVHVTYRPLSKTDLINTASVIGRAIPDLQVYVLDEHQQPVPIGVPGEMYVGGAGVTRGYLNRLELTQQRFISHPFEEGGASKLYKTGDKARYLPNGELEYLGRIDNQVKIRGFRIELGEVEVLLASHPAVWENVVVVREDEPGDKRLVAYVVPSTEQLLTVAQLRQFLKAKLPEYMVPSAFVLLESFPLTSNGKVDRRALPKPELGSTLLEKYVAPRTPIEEMLAQIWAQVLKVEQVGIHDNFFELGGHSLLATQVVSRIRNIFKVELQLRSLFATATLTELAHLIEQLQQQNSQLSVPPILPRDKSTDLPLSYAQQRLWFLDQLQPNSALYNIPIALHLSGNLNQAALEQSLQEIVQRHEVLHTKFIPVDGQPTQIIQKGITWIISIVDLKHLPTSQQKSALQQLAQQQATEPFNLATEPLIRAKILVLSQTEHVLLLCMHHIVSDGWSIGVFVQELESLYNAYSQGQPSLLLSETLRERDATRSLLPLQGTPLALLSIQYADFAIWQREWLQGDVLQSQLNYWQQQLKDAPTLLSLPTDRPRPAVQSFAGTYQEFALSGELTKGLTKLSQQQGVTLFMTLLAAYDTLLYRYTGQEDILVGSPIANRDRSEIEGLIGFFANTLVMRTDLAGNPSFSELLTRVREVALGAYAHQHLPFEMLVEALQPERDLSHTPLFQVMFVLQNAPTSGVDLNGLTVTPLIVEGVTAKFDLTLAMQNTSTGLMGVWEYNTDLFDASTIERMTGHFVTLLESIITNPQQPISQLPMLIPSEQQQLLVEWNDTSVDYPQDLCIHQLFERQLGRNPDAVAVVFGNQQLTYDELNCQANQLAHYLRSLGVKPDVLVGICVERSLEMVVGLLAILKAGGAYLPLDPEYPTERLSFMLEDAQVSVLLTQQQLVDKLLKHQANLVCLDEVWEQIAQNNQDNPTSGVRAFHLANVIYTSGSTGKPKGVMVEHKGLCNLAQGQIQTFGLTSDSRILQFASLSFDASIWEVVMAWGSGATLYLGTKESLLPGIPLIERLRDYSITHVTLPPSALAVMPIEELPALQTMIVGGEACSVELIRQWSAGINFFNAYGPTEATVCATIAKCTNNDEKISIGRAIANTQVYILDKNLQLVPVGVPGELHIGGVGLARGYLNRPELTQEKFINNPFGSGCLYKTGDLVRYLSDGNIEYLGRIDNQVKIRGFRIELAEIESLLGQHSDVQNCCVIAHEGTGGNKRLVAYVVPQKDVTLTTDELRQLLTDKLPGYMVPAAFMILECLPLTPNGKVNRRALPKPDLHQQLSDYVMPNTAVERIIAGIWQKALEVEKVGIYNNFFELGGHSLLLVKINQQLQAIFDLEMSIVDMFNYPTIYAFGQYLSTKISKEDKVNLNNRTESHSKIKHLKSKKLQFRQQYRLKQKIRIDSSENEEFKNSEIAIIAVAGRFPGAKDIESFWQNIHDGVESISSFTDEELLESGVSLNLLSNSNYVKASGVLEDIELFDANFFGYSAKEAELIDPQQRLFLELAWEAIEKAGYDPQTYNGLISVYAGVGMNHYLLKNLYPNYHLIETVDPLQLVISNEKDFLPTRVAYKLNLTGTAVNVQTACSTSLVAVHLACQSLINGECDMALAGGVSLGILQKTGYLYQEGMILSPDGHCRTFDAKAQGTVSGSGAGIVILKRLKDAIADRDHIHAIIKGSASNNDGAMKVGYTAPGVSGQAAVISEAQVIAGVDAETISYIEAHGTATPLGDPIEITALTQAFSQSTDKKSFCAIGSVKTNLGHLDTAAGVTGLIKTALALQHKILPPSLHFETPNPKIDFANSPFYVNTTLTEWKTNDTPRRAGVSSFGMGGTNAHVILEEAPLLRQGSRGAGEQRRNYQLLVVSAKTASALEKATANLVTHLKEHPELNLGDVAYTLNSGRRGFNYRWMLVCQDLEDAVKGLSNLESKQVFTNYTEITERSVVFMFPGQGSQYVNMAQEIYETETVFKEQVDYCSEVLKPLLGQDLRHILYPGEEKIDEASKQLQQTAIAQPAIFVIEYALAKLWQSYGVEPQAAIGHSIGEYVAATLAEVFSLEDALSLVAARGQMMQQLPTGAMLSVPLPAEKVKSLLGSELSVAAINQPLQCVVSGSIAAIEALQNQLAAQGIECRRLHTSHAFHSQMMEPILETFVEQVKKVTLNPPKIPYISNLTGTWITVTQATNPDYYAQHLRSTVLFASGVEKLLATPEQVLLEVGPGHTLTTLAKRHLNKAAAQTVLTSVRHPQDKKSDISVLFNTLGQLWLIGVNVDWFGFYSYQEYYRLPLPTYPFERQRYWIEPPKKHNDELYKIESSPKPDNLQSANLAALHTRPDLPNSYVAPRNEVEEKIANIWQELIGIKQIGINDNFFDLGGDSLIAVQILTRLRNTFSIQLSVSNLFESPTIAEIALKLEQQPDNSLDVIDEDEYEEEIAI